MADRSGNRKPVQIGDDGELLSGVFCVKCGTLNPHGMQYCQKCSDILAEQGSDLPKRLARIRRHASQTRTDAPLPSYRTGQFETVVTPYIESLEIRAQNVKKRLDSIQSHKITSPDSKVSEDVLSPELLTGALIILFLLIGLIIGSVLFPQIFMRIPDHL